MIDLSKHGVSVLEHVLDMIEEGSCKRCDLGHNTIVYKVPSSNPNKFTIRIDIAVNKEEE